MVRLLEGFSASLQQKAEIVFRTLSSKLLVPDYSKPGTLSSVFHGGHAPLRALQYKDVTSHIVVDSRNWTGGRDFKGFAQPEAIVIPKSSIAVKKRDFVGSDTCERPAPAAWNIGKKQTVAFFP